MLGRPGPGNGPCLWPDAISFMEVAMIDTLWTFGMGALAGLLTAASLVSAYLGWLFDKRRK